MKVTREKHVDEDVGNLMMAFCQISDGHPFNVVLGAACETMSATIVSLVRQNNLSVEETAALAAHCFDQLLTSIEGNMTQVESDDDIMVSARQ